MAPVCACRPPHSESQHHVRPRRRGRSENPRALLKEKGIEIAGGFGPLAGKIFRIGVMGPLATEKNVDLLVDALVECMKA